MAAPARSCSTVSCRILKQPRKVRLAFCRSIEAMEKLLSTKFRGYIRRQSNEQLDVFVVTEACTERDLGPLWRLLRDQFVVNLSEAIFDETNFKDVILLDKRFTAIYQHGQEEGKNWSDYGYGEDLTDYCSVASSIH